MISKFAIVALLIVIAFMAGGLLNPVTVYVREPQTQQPAQPLKQIVVSDNITTAGISVPAVDSEGNGVVSEITVQAMPGTGKALANIDRLLFWIDTQQSIQTARLVAQNITAIDVGKFDLSYTIEANASLVEGPSAGAALTIATIAALENRTINKSVMITGTIEPDGSIGPVGGVSQKANAAISSGAKLFLIPSGSISEVSEWKKEKKCQQNNGVTWCDIDYVPAKTELDIDVKEVSNISQALEYILI